MLIDEEKNCTFKPKVGRTATTEKPKTVSHQTRCMSKLHFEQKQEEEYRQCTFNPTINPNYRHVESRYLSTPSTSAIAGGEDDSRVEKDSSEGDLADSVKGIDRHLELRRKALLNEKEREKRMHSAFGIYSHDHPPNEKCIFCNKVDFELFLIDCRKTTASPSIESPLLHNHLACRRTRRVRSF